MTKWVGKQTMRQLVEQTRYKRYGLKRHRKFNGKNYVLSNKLEHYKGDAKARARYDRKHKHEYVRIVPVKKKNAFNFKWALYYRRKR